MNQLTLSECSKRKLDETFLVVYAIKNIDQNKSTEKVEKPTISVLFCTLFINFKTNAQILFKEHFVCSI